MEQSAREKFYERIEAAPLAARGFFESVDEDFRRRNGVDVRFTHTTFADMRLWAVWEADAGKQRKIQDVQDVFQKQSTRDGLRQEIYDLLYDEKTGLPATKYDDDALDANTDVLFQFFENSFATSSYLVFRV